MSLSLFKNRDNKFIKDNFQKLIFENFTFFFLKPHLPVYVLCK